MGLPLDDLLDDYDTALRARRRSESTRANYLRYARRLTAWLRSEGLSCDVDTIDNRTLERYLVHLSETLNPTTVAIHYRTLRALWGWLVVEEELAGPNPFAKLREPSVPDEPPDVLSESTITKLLATTSGKDFTSRRDRAILLTLIDTGVRVAELVGMDLGDFDRDQGVLIVTGKRDKTRPVPIGDGTADALGRYLRARRSHSFAHLDALWLGSKGALTKSGVAQMLDRRTTAAKVGHIHPHQFRHTFAHEWLDSGGQEGDLMRLGGWSSDAMIRRYGRSASTARAIKAHRKLSPVDRMGLGD